MEFDGLARFQQTRNQRHLGALQREGIPPARRHPSASRYRRNGFVGDSELVYQPSAELRQLSREYPMMGKSDDAQRHVRLDRQPPAYSNDGPKEQHQNSRSFSAPPVRMPKTKFVSQEMKLQRASQAARALKEMESKVTGNPLGREGISKLYEWLKVISLQEHLPALLELGVEDISHLGDLEVEDLEEAGMARPERKRFLRKQADLSLAQTTLTVPRPKTAHFIQSCSSRGAHAGGLSARSGLSAETAGSDLSEREDSIGGDAPSTERTESSEILSSVRTTSRGGTEEPAEGPPRVRVLPPGADSSHSERPPNSDNVPPRAYSGASGPKQSASQQQDTPVAQKRGAVLSAASFVQRLKQMAMRSSEDNPDPAAVQTPARCSVEASNKSVESKVVIPTGYPQAALRQSRRENLAASLPSLALPFMGGGKPAPRPDQGVSVVREGESFLQSNPPNLLATSLPAPAKQLLLSPAGRAGALVIPASLKAQTATLPMTQPEQQKPPLPAETHKIPGLSPIPAQMETKPPEGAESVGAAGASSPVMSSGELGSPPVAEVAIIREQSDAASSDAGDAGGHLGPLQPSGEVFHAGQDSAPPSAVETALAAVRAGGVRAVMDELVEHGGWVEVGEAACKALEVLCGEDAAARQRAGELGGVQAVLDAMHAHQSSAALQAAACGVLSELSFVPALQLQIAQEGGVSAIIDAMRAHPSVPTVCAKASRALCNLAFESCPVQMQVAADGGVAVIVEAMEAHAGVAQVQAEGCGALCNLGASNEANWRVVVAQGGLSAVVQGMLAHGAEEDVQVKGCAALSSLTGPRDAREGAVGAGAIGAIVKAMLMHVEVEEVQCKGCSALLNLVEVRPDVAAQVGREGGVAAVVKGAVQHEGRARVQSKAFRCLAALSASRENKQHCTSQGATESVIATMQRHAKEPEVHQAACLLLANLVKDGSNLDRLVFLRAPQALVASMSEFAGSSGHVADVCHILSLLCLSEDARELLLQPKTLQSLAESVISPGTCCCPHAHSALSPCPAPISHAAVCAEQISPHVRCADSAVSVAVQRLEQALSPLEARLELDSEAPDTVESVRRSRGKRGERRPISALLHSVEHQRAGAAGKRPASSEALRASSGAVRPCPRPRPRSAMLPGAVQLQAEGTRTSAARDTVRCGSGAGSRLRRPMSGSRHGAGAAGGAQLAMEHRIVSLRKEAEVLRNENLRIMAGAVLQHAQSELMADVPVKTTTLSANLAPFHANNGKKRTFLRPPSGKSIRPLGLASHFSTPTEDKENDAGAVDKPAGPPQQSAAYSAQRLLELLPERLRQPAPLRLPASERFPPPLSSDLEPRTPFANTIVAPLASGAVHVRRGKSAKGAREGARLAREAPTEPIAPAVFDKISTLMDAGRTDRQIMADFAVHTAGVTPAQLHKVRQVRR
jgi:hypothetical protein